jgi:DNA-binding MarR family transcriptional regulator
MINMKKRLTPEFELAFEESSELTGFLIWQTTNLWQRRMKEKLDPIGITHVQFLLLNSLATLNKTSDKPLTQMMVANHAHCDKMMASKVLRLLEERHYLIRKPHHLDTRSKSLLITTKGMDLLEKATPVLLAVENSFFKSLKSKKKSIDKRLRKVLKSNQKTASNHTSEESQQED